MSFLDPLLAVVKQIAFGGNVLPPQNTVNFASLPAGSTVVDNPALKRTDVTITGGTSAPTGSFKVSLSACVVATQTAAAQERLIGENFFDPAIYTQLSSTSTIVFHAILRSTTAGDAANCDLWRLTGTGSPALLGTVSTTSLTPVDVHVDVSASFRPGQASGNFGALIYLTTASNLFDYATASAAWLEITP
jgi:hypothetical protein